MHLRRPLTPLLTVCALAGCQTALPDVTPSPPVLRTLTQEQYAHAVRDLVADDVYVPSDLDVSLRLDGLEALGTAAVAVSPSGVERYERAAYLIAEQAMDDDHRDAVMPCTPADAQDAGCATLFVETFGRRAWRRPLTDAEVGALVEVAMGAAGVLGDFHDGLEYAIAGLLQSPDFLMRPELGEPDAENGGRRYTNWEMASRLSFFLWNTIPDDALLDAAEAGELVTTEGIDAQVERMINDPRAHDGLRAWVSDLLQLHRLDDLQKDPAVFLQFTDGFKEAAGEETLAFFDDLVFTRDTDLRDMMTSRHTFVDRTLARLYGVKAPSRDGFGPVELDPEGPRAGLLGQASTLAIWAHPTTSSATLRGKFIRGTLLCDPLPPPPAGVNTSIPEASPDAPTLRDRVKVHLENPSCAGCHTKMDPLGLGLEQFDGVGAFRTLEADATIDPAGDVDGVPFTDGADLGVKIREHEGFVPCLTSQLASYAMGRHPADGDEAAMTWLTDAFAAHDHRLLPLWMEMAVNPMFRQVGEVE
ncbi:MAG: DUF1592 domain-containing protein [Alphaproteobacteria bacterium]|nr:DUF1592 domain-containing protein [Alphaproteobacteria bacterium]